MPAGSPPRPCSATWPRPQDPLVNCATFAVTLLDFSVPDHDRPVLASPDHRRELRLRSTKRAGVLRGNDATALFSPAAAQRPMWNYWVRNNLLGEEPPAFDILAWNSDSTRLPAALHADFLDMFLHNSLATGEFAVHGSPIDLGKVECDSFVVGARTDHLTAWKACYATTQLLGWNEPVRPVLVGPHPEPGQSPRATPR